MKEWLPKAEVEFAARFGFLTRELWLRFFETGARTSSYVRWRRLVSRGFFKVHPSTTMDELLILNRKNSWRICSHDPVQPPKLSQVRHDEIAATGALSLLKAGLTQLVQPEIELKRTDFDWSRANRSKYPDLLVHLGERRVAVEVELTQKSQSRYQLLASSYGGRSDLELAVFVVQNRAIMNSIVRAFRKSDLTFGFMKVEDWLKDACGAKIVLSDSVTTFRELNREFSKGYRELSSR